MSKKSRNSTKQRNYIIPAALLFIIAVIWRFFGTNLYYSVETRHFSARNLIRLNDRPDASNFLVETFMPALSDFFLYYFLPALILLGSIILLSIGLANLYKKGSSLFSFLEDNGSEKKFLVILFLAVFIIVISFQFIILQNYPAVSDEFCYIFQSNLLSSGHIIAPSPPLPQFFQFSGIINDGKWYSKTTIGWPLLLAIGNLIKMPFVINPLCTALIVLILYFTGKILYGKTGGLIAASLAVFSPFFPLLGATYFPHTSSALFTVLYILMLLKTFEEKSLINPIIAGLSIAFLIQVRPSDAGIVFASLIPLTIYLFIKSNDKKHAILRMSIILVLLAAGAGLLMYVNSIQNGSPLLFGYQKYDPDEKLGFGHHGHTLIKALFDTSFTFLRNAFWTIPFVLIFFILSLFSKEKRAKLIFLVPLCFTIFYFCFFTNGTMEFGARYYLVAFLVAIIPSTGGILWIKEEWQRRKLPGSEAFVPSFLIITSLFMVFAVYSRILPDIPKQYVNLIKVGSWLDNPPGIKPPALVFYKFPPDQTGSGLRNQWNYKDQGEIFATFLTPAENSELIKLFPERKVYSLVFNEKEGAYEIVKGIDNAETASNYYLAGMNYWRVINNTEKAEEIFKKALQMEPDNKKIMMNLGEFYTAVRKGDKAAGIYEELAKKPDNNICYYLLGRSCGELGKTKESTDYFQKFISGTKDRGLADKANRWIRYYNSNRGNL